MDKDEFFKILDDSSCFNHEVFILDKTWATNGTLSHIQSEKEDLGLAFFENSEQTGVNKNNLKKDKNSLKMTK